MAMRILLVDDEPDIIYLLKKLLESEGYTIDCAYDGMEALEKVRADRPDIVLLDILMPKLNGFEVCEAIKSDENLRNIIVIMLSVKYFTADRERGLHTGADYYLTKPFSGEELKALIRQIAENQIK